MNYNMVEPAEVQKFIQANEKGSETMATEHKRMTFVVTPEIESLLDGMKKEIFYNCSQAEMIRTLVEAGLNVHNTSGEENEKENDINA